MSIQAPTISVLQFSNEPIVLVDRSVPPNYPDFFWKVVYDFKENPSPSEFSLSALEPIPLPGLLEKQQHNGQEIFDFLARNDFLVHCIDLRDLEEVEKKGPDFFQQRWSGEVLFGWKSVIKGRGNDLSIPYVTRPKVRVSWRLLEECPGPVFRFPSK